MNRRSIRFRLTAWYAAILAVTFAAAGSGVYLALRDAINGRLNASEHRPWRDYYTTAMAAQVYHAYERDFDRLRYPRGI